MTGRVDPVRQSLSSLFNWNPRSSISPKTSARKRRRTSPMWTHTFVCLQRRDADVPPDAHERAQLQIAGLGEKRVTLCLNAEAQDFYQEIMSYFPQLSSGGGFLMLRSTIPRQYLDVIEPPTSGYTSNYLKAVAQQAKIYIRPLQRDLICTVYEGDVSNTCTCMWLLK